VDWTNIGCASFHRCPYHNPGFDHDDPGPDDNRDAHLGILILRDLLNNQQLDRKRNGNISSLPQQTYLEQQN
jgi:hypothetical protein